jgi:hypothetical protein
MLGKNEKMRSAIHINKNIIKCRALKRSFLATLKAKIIIIIAEIERKI